MRRDLRWHPRAIGAAIRGRLRALFARGAIEREIDEEIRFHLDMEIDKNIKAGMTHAAAHRAALVAFGGVERTTESHRDARGTRFVDETIADIRYAARTLARAPTFVVVSVFTLAVAIAIASAGFTATNAFLFRPLPVPHGDQLLAVFTSDFNGREQHGASSYADIVDFQRAADSVADLAGETRVMLAVRANENVTFTQGALVTSRYFQTLRIRPVLGRFPVVPDAPTIVLGHTLWRRAFLADSSIIGRRVQVNGQPFTVAAVAPPEFRGINREIAVEFWMDAALSPIVLRHDNMVRQRGYRSYRVIARLRGAQSIDALNARLSSVAGRLFRSYPDVWRDTTGASRTARAMRELDAHTGSMPRTQLVLLVAGALAFGFGLLAIACTNLASMQMARAASRRREIATRLALGAGRGRLVRQLLAECSLIAVPGIVLGVILALIAAALVSRYRPIPLPSLDMNPDWTGLAFVAAALVITVLIFGLVPALQAVRADVLTDLKGGAQPGADGLRIGGVRGGLIVAQVASSVLFTALAGLIAFGLAHTASQGRDQARKVLVTRVNFLPAAGDDRQTESLANEILAGIHSIPGVEAASASASIPVRGARWSVYAETRSREGETKKRELDVVYVRPSYFDVVGIPRVRGRDFESRDIAAEARVAIVSKAMAGVLWPGEDALGKSMRLNDGASTAEVIGVVADPDGFVPATDRSYPGLVYLPQPIRREAEVMFQFRAPRGQAAIAARVAAQLRRYETRIVAPPAMTIDEYLDRALGPQRIIARASGVAAAFQVVLAIAGLSGLVAYVTALRRREIGIRTALGATRVSVLRLVLRQGVRLTAMGAAIGLALSGIVAEAIADTVSMTPAVVASGLLLAAAGFAVIGMIAMVLSARRAFGVSPAAALRVD